MSWEQIWPNDIRIYQGRGAVDGTKPVAPEGSKLYHLDDGTRWTYHKGEGWVPSTEDINLVWDTDLLAPVLMQQPLIKTDELTVDGSMAVTNFPATDKYKLSDMDSSGEPSYYGYLDPDGAWYVMELNISLGTARYAKGADTYAANWAGRAGLSYSYYNNVF